MMSNSLGTSRRLSQRETKFFEKTWFLKGVSFEIIIFSAGSGGNEKRSLIRF